MFQIQVCSRCLTVGGGSLSKRHRVRASYRLDVPSILHPSRQEREGEGSKRDPVAASATKITFQSAFCGQDLLFRHVSRDLCAAQSTVREISV